MTSLNVETILGINSSSSILPLDFEEVSFLCYGLTGYGDKLFLFLSYSYFQTLTYHLFLLSYFLSL
jgi:hypothetical protein